MLSSFTGSFAFGRRRAFVTSGLTLLLDAGSYPGSGSTWSDTSGNGADATLVNSPTYSTSDGGYFTFVPASTQYATVAGTPLNTTAYTKYVWCRFNASTDNNLVSSSAGGHFMFTGGTSKLYCGHANWTANFTNLNISSNYASSVTLVISQGAIGYYPNAVQIGGVAQTINWQGNITPTPSTNRTDVVTFSILYTGSSYIVLGQLTGF